MKPIDTTELSPLALFMVQNKGFYFWDKKRKTNIDKWEIFITFKGKELEDVYNDIQGRYLRKKRNKLFYEEQLNDYR